MLRNFCIVYAARAIGKQTKDIINKEVMIGDNVFIGAQTTILPGKFNWRRLHYRGGSRCESYRVVVYILETLIQG